MGGAASRSSSASRCAPSGPRPFLPLSSMLLVPLAPTPLTTCTVPRENTCPQTRGACPQVAWQLGYAQGPPSVQSSVPPSTPHLARSVRRSSREGLGSRTCRVTRLDLCGAGQEGRQHRPDPVPQVLSPAQPCRYSSVRRGRQVIADRENRTWECGSPCRGRGKTTSSGSESEVLK